jgi:hexosaminidase
VPERAVYDFDFSVGRAGKGMLYINDFNVVDNNSGEYPRYFQNSGKIALEAGTHRIRLEYFTTNQGGLVRLGCTYNGTEVRNIPASWFTH